MSLTIIHCAEDQLSAYCASTVLDRAVAERAGSQWIRDLWAPEARKDARQYVDLDGRLGWSNRGGVQKSRERNPRLRFHPRDKEGKSLGGLAAHAYVCYRLASLLEVPDDRLLLLSFDVDRHQKNERCGRGILAAIEGLAPTVRLKYVIAEAVPEFDGWVLAGFVSQGSHEARRLSEEIGRLVHAGYDIDPTRRPHLLTSTVAEDARDAKSICKRLLDLAAQADPANPRVAACLEDVELANLEFSGAEAGIRDFIEQIGQVVLPLVGDPHE